MWASRHRAPATTRRRGRGFEQCRLGNVRRIKQEAYGNASSRATSSIGFRALEEVWRRRLPRRHAGRSGECVRPSLRYQGAGPLSRFRHGGWPSSLGHDPDAAPCGGLTKRLNPLGISNALIFVSSQHVKPGTRLIGCASPANRLSGLLKQPGCRGSGGWRGAAGQVQGDDRCGRASSILDASIRAMARQELMRPTNVSQIARGHTGCRRGDLRGVKIAEIPTSRSIQGLDTPADREEGAATVMRKRAEAARPDRFDGNGWRQNPRSMLPGGRGEKTTSAPGRQQREERAIDHALRHRARSGIETRRQRGGDRRGMSR